MLEPVILGLLGTVTAGAVGFGFKVEHRLTRLETKMDGLLKKNGLEPGDYVLKNNNRKR